MDPMGVIFLTQDTPIFELFNYCYSRNRRRCSSYQWRRHSSLCGKKNTNHLCLLRHGVRGQECHCLHRPRLSLVSWGFRSLLLSSRPSWTVLGGIPAPRTRPGLFPAENNRFLSCCERRELYLLRLGCGGQFSLASLILDTHSVPY